MSIIKLLEKNLNRFLFTTPTHSQKSPTRREFAGFYKWDFSELDGFDDLQNPTGAILDAMEHAAKIYNTQRTFFLTNGSTQGILAIMLALLNENDRVLIARNCHKSVFSGLCLTHAKIDWIMPNTKEDWGIYGEIDPKALEDTLKLNDYKAFILTSPTYEGINSDIAKISAICKQYNVYLIVDEAHGALYNFSNLLPKTAIEQGADFSVNSLHKNAGALNPNALLHVSKNTDVPAYKIQKTLNLITTTSPSYPQLANIEATIEYLDKKGEREIKKLISLIEKFEKEAQKQGYEFLNADKTKIVMRRENTNMETLSAILSNGFNIEDEMVNEHSILFLTGIGTHKNKLKRLLEAINYIKIPQSELAPATFQPFPFVKIQPCETLKYNYTYIPREEAVLTVSAQTIIKCPPCSAIIYEGEVIQEWHTKFLDENVKVFKNEF